MAEPNGNLKLIEYRLDEYKKDIDDMKQDIDKILDNQNKSMQKLDILDDVIKERRKDRTQMKYAMFGLIPAIILMLLTWVIEKLL
jgi:uncharacterized protein YoxC